MPRQVAVTVGCLVSTGKENVMNSRSFITGIVCCLCACFVLWFAATPAMAQAGRGSISGLVTDPNGALVQGAQVELKNPATGVTQHTVTSGAGLYTFISLNPGVYQVKVSQSGLPTQRRTI
ncbi:MAG TPA: carboxypeptidase-like regulatory domain-containing protein [Candidatus Binatia bacterium]|nr:carboxypeptidase-like regulatory domain-containing protein [Candidatus Binatia bacterium]